METRQQILIIYILIVNLITFAAYGIDKRRAIKNRWRIPENTLLGLAVIGGSIGALVGMYGFRHKTKHLMFKVGIPTILLVQLGLVYLYQMWD